jgi:hypothetical protein
LLQGVDDFEKYLANASPDIDPELEKRFRALRHTAVGMIGGVTDLLRNGQVSERPPIATGEGRAIPPKVRGEQVVDDD